MIYPFCIMIISSNSCIMKKIGKRNIVIMKSLMLSVLIKFYIINSFAKRNQISFLANRI